MLDLEITSDNFEHDLLGMDDRAAMVVRIIFRPFSNVILLHIVNDCPIQSCHAPCDTTISKVGGRAVLLNLR